MRMMEPVRLMLKDPGASIPGTSVVNSISYLELNHLNTQSENGHVIRMEDTRLPNKILFGTMVGGKKSEGKPKKSWVGCLEEDCAKAKISYGS
jgi:hypothetical protein